MKPRSIFAGALLIALGLVFLSYYEAVYKPNKDAGRLLREARMIHERGDKESLKAALDLATSLVASYPDSKYVPDATFLIADTYERTGLYRLAYLKYSYIAKDARLAKRPDLASEVGARLGVLKIKRNYSEEGIAQLINLVASSTDPNFRSRVYTEIGYARIKLEKYNDAENAFLLALREDPENEEALLGKSRALARQGKSDEAQSGYDTFIKKKGDASLYSKDVKRLQGVQLYNTALDEVRGGRYSAGRAHFREFIRQYPSSRYVENAYYWIGESYYAIRHYGSALTWFNKALSNRWHHKDEDAKIKLGYAYYMQAKYDLAAREFNSYLAKYPSGRYRDVARRWKESSSREIINRIRPDAGEGDRAQIQSGLDEQMRGSRTTRQSYVPSQELDSVTEL